MTRELDAAGALAQPEGVTDLYVANGKKTLHLGLTRDRPPNDEIMALIL